MQPTAERCAVGGELLDEVEKGNLRSSIYGRTSTRVLYARKKGQWLPTKARVCDSCWQELELRSSIPEAGL